MAYYRDGPPQPELIKISSDARLNVKNYEVSNGSSYVEHVKGNVSLLKGRWYFEVTQKSGTVYVGWCQETFKTPEKSSSSLGSTDDSWSYCPRNQATFHKGEKNTYGSYSYSYSDTVVGCFLDLAEGVLSFSLNGADAGPAFRSVKTKRSLWPAISLAANSSCVINFGTSPFKYPPKIHLPLAISARPNDTNTLTSLFNHYKKLGEEDEPAESIAGEGLLAFAKDMGHKGNDDPLVIIISWKLGVVKAPWEFDKREFVDGFSLHGCYTKDQMRQKAQEWRASLDTPSEYSHFYCYAFEYQAIGRPSLSVAEAVIAWELLQFPQRWGMFNKFREFLELKEKEGKIKGVSKDVWDMVLPFSRKYPNNFDNYDPNSDCWPLLFDDFIPFSRGTPLPPADDGW